MTLKKRSGFTLIELLVVVAIIALLVAILLPSLGLARTQARRAKCAANVRTFGMAMYAYANQFEQTIPHDGRDSSGNAQDNNFNWDDNSFWVNALPSQMNAASKGYWDMIQDDTAGRARLPLGGDNNAFVCPDATTATSLAANPADVNGPYHSNGRVGGAANTAQKFFISYVLNSKLNSTTNAAYGLRLNQMEPPAAVVLMLEKRMRTDEVADNLPFALNAGAYGAQYPANRLNRVKGDSKRFSYRHGDGGNVLFFDGHVEFFKYRDVLAPAIASPGSPAADYNQPGRGLIWNPYGVSN